MNNRDGGYCLTRYGDMYNMSKVENIMLKFRPIAPKPVADGSDGSATGSRDEYVKCGRSKKKYVRVNKSKNINKKKNNNFKRSQGDRKKDIYDNKKTSPPAPVVTLSLLPETPDRKENKPVKTGFSDLVSQTQECNYYDNYYTKLSPAPVQTKKCNYDSYNKLSPAPVWLSFNKPTTPAPRRPKVVSNVTVECLTDTFVDSDELGCTDEERVRNMEKDTCPGFISDGQDRVVWTNKAYRQMARVGHVVDGDDVAVVLVRKDKTPPVTYSAFTCKVRVSSGLLKQTPSPVTSPTLTLPCDVWRMERGAFAWRLDVKAALSLGR